MKRFIPLLIVALFFIPSQISSAGESERISIDLGGGMISTAPLVIGEQVFIKSIGQLSALNATTGEMNWQVKHPTPHLFETSPLLHHSTEIVDSVLTGWTDGMICAYDALSGKEIWNHSTESKQYGITGRMILNEGELVAPFDHGLLVLNPSNGQLIWQAAVVEERFYRSSPFASEGGFLLGSESGKVWSFEQGTPPVEIFQSPESISSPKIRGPVVEIDNRLLVPVQGTTNSSLVETDGNSTVLHPLGGSLALMAVSGNDVLMSSSRSSKMFDCATWCVEFQILTDEPVVGEVIFDNGKIILPVNSAEGKWLRFVEDCDGSDCDWISLSPLYHSHPQYLTAAPAHFSDAIIMVNDAGWVDIGKNEPLRAHVSPEKTENPAPNSSIIALFFLIPGSLLIMFGVGKEGLNNFLPALGASLILLGAGYYIPTLQNLVTVIESESVDPLREEIPEQWIGSQVVVFELSHGLTASHQGNDTFIDHKGIEIAKVQSSDTDGRLYVGGLSGYQDVRSLTMAAADIAGLLYVDHLEELGYRVDRIGGVNDGENGQWLIYYEDGNVGLLAIDANSIKDDATIIWKMENY